MRRPCPAEYVYMNKYLLLPLLFLSACSTLTPAGEKVRLVKSKERVKHCTPTGKVEVNGSGGGAERSHEVDVRFRNMAGEYGNTVLVTKDEGGFYTSEMKGIVFKCPPSPKPASVAEESEE